MSPKDMLCWVCGKIHEPPQCPEPPPIPEPRKGKAMIRWISYTQQNIPGNVSFQLGFYRSLVEAKCEYKEFCQDVGSDECTMLLYGTPSDKNERDDMVAGAKDFADIGCPFDYPDRVIERGPNGGIVVKNT